MVKRDTFEYKQVPDTKYRGDRIFKKNYHSMLWVKALDYLEYKENEKRCKVTR